VYDEISSILFRHDVAEINFEFNTDEYELEVDAILPRINDSLSKEDLVNIIYEEFVNFFCEGIIKPKGHTDYIVMDDEIWDVWSKRTKRD
jgi:hypothetical protein